MKTIIQYVVADENNVYDVATTREQARLHLKGVKFAGKKTAKIYKEEYALIQIDQVR